jgi:two-component system CheB/CheR fusion protein
MSNRKQSSTEKNKAKIPGKTERSQFPIVGIGASAGGLEALELFFENMPENNGMAFIVIQHLDPNYIGMMPELLQRITPMKVFQASDNLHVQPNCVYVIPPNKSLSILRGTLHLFEPVESRGLRLPIDIFFRSMADDMQDNSIGIILSGMGSDGTLGLKAIKEKNGIVLVQSPVTAKFNGMPTSAIEAVIADVVAPVEELPAKLIALLKFSPAVKTDPDLDSKVLSNLDKIIILLREQSGHDFSLYKKHTLFRRIERRKGAHQIDKIHTYVRYLQETPKEVEILFKDLLIGVTSFFRDTAVWEMLREKALPELIRELPYGYVLRAWVIACSTGEEAYSLAIVFKEVLEKVQNHNNLTLQIFATDLDTDSIEIARKGVYASNIIADVSPDRLSRFFTPEAEGFRVNTIIREMVVFAPQNVIKDPPFTRLDILTCRNLLIYMEPELQGRLMTLFNYSLNQGGILVLGNAETMVNNHEGFEELDSWNKIFKRTVTSREPGLIDFPSAFYPKKTTATKEKIMPTAIEGIRTLADQLLLQRFAPASVLVNDKGDILYMTGLIGKYLELVAGEANWNIHAMAREGFRNDLPGALRKAMQNFDPVIVRNIKIGTNEGTRFVDVTVQRIENPGSLRGMVMVVFTDVPALVEQDAVNPKTGKRRLGGKQKEWENKFQRCNEDLQSTREEMQASEEELKSTNEELQSTNEELQSTNEELTTSKEEMQSMNEELRTVNFELKTKVSDFTQASNDMQNLLNSIEIATLFLDKELNIRRFTEPLFQIMKIRNLDIGRPFTDITTDLNYPELLKHARQVLKTLAPVESPISTNDGRWFNVRIFPYRTFDDRIEGLVITFIDITGAENVKKILAEKNEILKVSEIRFRRLFETSKDGMLILNAKTGMILAVNPFMMELLGFSKEQFLKKAIWEISPLNDLIGNQEKFSELQVKKYVRYKNLPIETAGGKKVNVEFISSVYLSENKEKIQCQIRIRSKPDEVK